MTDKTATESEGVVRKLLILDDDIMTGETIRRIGEYAGLECRHTVSPAEFFRLVGEWAPDVIALDLLMPEMDGVEVMAQLSDLDCDADLIITSGVGDKVLNAARLSASGHGLNTLGVLPKPFSPAKLRALLASNGDSSGKPGSANRGQSCDRITSEDLRKAIEAGEITVAYQPKIVCKTGTLAGFEALARWSRNGRPVSPDRFIPLAEANNLIDDLTRLVFDQALRWLANFAHGSQSEAPLGLGQIHLSLNISARSLSNESLFRSVVSLCDELGIDRRRIIFELTESSAMGDAVKALDTLTRLRMQGFKVSIDDFGTGFSSMVQLVRLPFSEIKIDKSFVMDCRSSDESRAVTRSIIDLGRSLGLYSTAEGVEDQETLAYLQSLGCDLAQGYFISRPLKGADVSAWHQQREAEREGFRLDSVRESALFGSESERRFDRITHLARRLLDVPVALINILDRDVQWIKSGSAGVATELPRQETFCTHTIALDGAFVVPDARLDERFRELDVVRGDQGIRFYAGYPVCLPNGAKIGTLCVLDRVVRRLSERETRILKHLAEMVETELGDLKVSGSELPNGIPAKDVLSNRTAALLDLAAQLEEPVAVILFTLDQLGDINRKFGRAMGDRCLNAVAEAITRVADGSDLVGRYRGAEIAIIRMKASVTDAQILFGKIQRALDEISASLSVPLHGLLSMAFLEGDKPAALEAAIEEARESATAVGSVLEGQAQ